MLDINGYVLARSGRPDDARQLVQELIRQGNTPLFTFVGLIPFGPENRDKTLQSIEMARRERSISITSLKVAPELDPFERNLAL